MHKRFYKNFLKKHVQKTAANSNLNRNSAFLGLIAACVTLLLCFLIVACVTLLLRCLLVASGTLLLRCLIVASVTLLFHCF